MNENITLDEYAPFADKIVAYYGTDGTAIAAYDTDYDSAWFTTYQAALVVVKAILFPKGITEQMDAQTQIWRDNMDLYSPKLADLEYSINKCLKNGTITDSFASFLTSQVKAATTGYNIDSFKTDYNGMILQVKKTGNKTALAAVGFTNAKIIALDGLFTNIDTADQSFNNFQTQRTNLRITNKTLLAQFYSSCTGVIKAGNTCFTVAGNPLKADLYVIAHILNIIRVPKATKPSNKVFKPLQTRVFYNKLPAKATIQLTLTKGAGILVGRSTTKTGYPTATMPVTATQISLKKTDFPGQGNYIHLINTSDKKATVKTFIINPPAA